MKTGIFSGSFNPIHTGHLILASYLHQYEGYEEIWLTVSPHNPLRERFSREKDIHRINMVKLAIEGIPGLQCCDIEFSLPQSVLFYTYTGYAQSSLSRSGVYTDNRSR